MRETDISKFSQRDENNFQYENPTKRILKAIGRVLFTVAMVFVAAGLVIATSLAIYIGGIAAEPTGIDLKAKGLNQTSFIYVKNEKGQFKKYQSLYSTENRVWVSYNEIPKYMGDAIIAIEDKRFLEHSGVDFTRTAGAILNLASGTSSYGGSTITQQLIKNITDDKEVSLNRKIREIVKALKLETEYTKDQILEAYMNVVNFGNNCQGVQSAANLYFGKNIDKCSIAQCAAIAGITQNPSKYNPLVFPENNKERREVVIEQMLQQGKITEEEYNEAMDESAKMKFVGFKKNNSKNISKKVQNWYLDELTYDLRKDLATYYNISENAAAEKIYTEGLKIYAAMDLDAQNYLEKAATSIYAPYDTGLQCAASMIGMDGRVIATVGSSQKKTANLLLDRATQSVLQPGSTIKPVVVYPYAIETKKLYYSSIVKDEPLPKYKVNEYGQLVPGPNNWYRGYKGNMLLTDAIEWSANATAAQVMNMIYPENAYEQVVTLQGFTHLKDEDKVNAGGLSIGGLKGGVTVREMAATFTYMGNQGLYYKPYTYYYVTDADDNIIIDNRDTIPIQSYSPETAYIMNRLLHYNITYSAHTNAAYARIPNWDIVGKTGTTDKDKDSWFCGVSPYCSLAIWTGFDKPRTITPSGQRTATTMFQDVMSHYLQNKKPKEYVMPPKIITANYNPSNGMAYNIGNAIEDRYIGYYTEDNMPKAGSGEYVANYNTYTPKDETTGQESGATEGSTTPAGENTSETQAQETQAQTNAPKTEAPTQAPTQHQDDNDDE